MIFAFILLLFSDRQPDHCRVFGLMHEVETRSKADFIVYEEESEAFADLIVYDQDNKLHADQSGSWHFVADERESDYKVFFTNDRDQAHFTVFFTDYESFAGCK